MRHVVLGVAFAAIGYIVTGNLFVLGGVLVAITSAIYN